MIAMCAMWLGIAFLIVVCIIQLVPLWLKHRLEVAKLRAAAPPSELPDDDDGGDTATLLMRHAQRLRRDAVRLRRRALCNALPDPMAAKGELMLATGKDRCARELDQVVYELRSGRLGADQLFVRLKLTEDAPRG